MPFDFVFEVLWYRDARGKEVAEEELSRIAQSNPQVANEIGAELRKLRDGRLHRPPFVVDLGDGILEVRIEGQVDVRILFSYAPGRQVIIWHAFAKKTQKTPPRNLAMAKRRRQAWMAESR